MKVIKADNDKLFSYASFIAESMDKWTLQMTICIDAMIANCTFDWMTPIKLNAKCEMKKI